MKLLKEKDGIVLIVEVSKPYNGITI